MKKIYLIAFIVFNAVGYNSFSQTKQYKQDNFKNPFQTKKAQEQPKTLTPNGSARFAPSQKKLAKVKESFHLKISHDEDISKSDMEGLLSKSSNFSLKEISIKTDKLGHKHESFQQYYKGLPIDGYISFKHTNDGTYLHGKVAKIDDLDVSPSISTADAELIAKNHLGVNKLLNEYPMDLKIAKIPGSEDEFALMYDVRIDAANPLIMKRVLVDAKSGEIINTIELIPHADTPGTASTLYSGVQNIIVDENEGIYRLRDNSRKIETYNASNAVKAGAGNDYYSNYTDFTNSSSHWEGIPYLTSFTISTSDNDWWYNPIVDNKADFYIIIKDNSDAVVFRSNYINNTNTPVTFFPNLILSNAPYSVEIWDFDLSDNDDFGGSYLISTNVGTNTYSDEANIGSYLIEELNNPALDVHWGMEVTYDFYKEIFNRNSYDGNGGVIKQFLNSPDLQKEHGESPNNAFAMYPPYNIMVYGLGDGDEMGPVVGLDVEGHEFTHMVINHNGSGGLVYQGESGALNESFADIFGTGVEFYSGVDPDWSIGEDLMLKQPFMRSMSNPNTSNHPDTYGGDYWVDPHNLSHDGGGVHINSGVQNFWFYLLSEGGAGTNDLGNNYSVAGIGMDKAMQIAYRNLTTYLGTNATFYDAYLGSLQAAEDLYGNPSTEVAAVRNAWYAVGVGNVPDASCGGLVELTTLDGVISDGSGTANYGNNLACSWLIAPPGADQITLNFTEFETENEFDYIVVYDGNSESHNVLATWWGAALPPEITSSGGALLIKFVTDEALNFNGWSLNYQSTGSAASCEGLSLLSETEGSINDGSGSSNYGNNQECYWYIAPPCASSVTLSFSEFETELDYDGLLVYDGISSEASQIAAFTGSDIPDDVTSSTGEMLLIFVSDYAVSKNGFTASYTSNGTSKCSGVTVVDDTDFGIISDGSGNENYCNNQECSWLISPPDAEIINLYFTDFDLEEQSPDGKSIYDAVEIYDGDSELAPKIGTYTGSTIPPSISSSGNSIFIKFYSDLADNRGGWSVEYNTVTETFCSGTQTLTENTGIISDGSQENNYGNNSFCSWLIKPETESKITLSFSDFDLEEDYDAVMVYDGEDAGAPLLSKLTGNSQPNSITSTSSALYIEFLSDHAIRKGGWSASYSTEQVLGINNKFIEGFEIFPNPVFETLFIQVNSKENAKVSIFDLRGIEVIKPTIVRNGVNHINISELKPGIYFVNIKSESNTFTEKVIVE